MTEQPLTQGIYISERTAAKIQYLLEATTLNTDELIFEALHAMTETLLYEFGIEEEDDDDMEHITEGIELETISGSEFIKHIQKKSEEMGVPPTIISMTDTPPDDISQGDR